MKNSSNLLILLVVSLLVTIPLTVSGLDGAFEEINSIDFQMETKINMDIVENQTVSASVSGVESVLSDPYSEQLDFYNNSAAIVYIDFEMHTNGFLGGNQLLDAVNV